MIQVPLGHIFQRIEGRILKRYLQTQIHYSIIHNIEGVEQIWNIHKFNSISSLKSQKG